MNKHETKKQLIIDTAFRVWGSSFFYNTSLTLLADALKMTKPGLYRYFKNKESLLDAMKLDFIEKYRLVLDRSKNQSIKNLDDLIIIYTDIPVRFFAENYNYYRFFVLKILHMKKDIRDIIKEISEEKHFFLSPELLINMGYSEIESGALSEFIISVGGYILNQHLFSDKPYTNTEIDKIIKVIRYITRYGISGNRTPLSTLNYKDIEKKSAITKEDILPYNKIFTAVAEVIATQGIWNTTVDSIAEHLQMAKSSLYFYFDNKDQMINEVIEREKEHLNTLIIQRVTQFETFEEQLYSILHVMSSYFILKPSIFSIMNWLRYQFINEPVVTVNKKLEKFSEYIELISQNSSFNPLGFPSDQIAEGLSFILIHGLWGCFDSKCPNQTLNLHIRKIHHLFLYGIKGFNK